MENKRSVWTRERFAATITKLRAFFARERSLSPAATSSIGRRNDLFSPTLLPGTEPPIFRRTFRTLRAQGSVGASRAREGERRERRGESVVRPSAFSAFQKRKTPEKNARFSISALGLKKQIGCFFFFTPARSSSPSLTPLLNPPSPTPADRPQWSKPSAAAPLSAP